MIVLHRLFPDLAELIIHESSPVDRFAQHLADKCPGYSISFFSPSAAPGSEVRGVRCEDLRSLSFPSATFDLFITQDVLEHVVSPERAVREIARVLKPGGSHVFTVPLWPIANTVSRVSEKAGRMVAALPPMYHNDRAEGEVALVATDWGQDIGDRIYRWTGMTTTILTTRDKRLGLMGEFLEVCVSRKPGLVERHAATPDDGRATKQRVRSPATRERNRTKRRMKAQRT